MTVERLKELLEDLCRESHGNAVVMFKGGSLGMDHYVDNVKYDSESDTVFLKMM